MRNRKCGFHRQRPRRQLHTRPRRRAPHRHPESSSTHPAGSTPPLSCRPHPLAFRSPSSAPRNARRDQHRAFPSAPSSGGRACRCFRRRRRSRSTSGSRTAALTTWGRTISGSTSPAGATAAGSRACAAILSRPSSAAAPATSPSGCRVPWTGTTRSRLLCWTEAAAGSGTGTESFHPLHRPSGEPGRESPSFPASPEQRGRSWVDWKSCDRAARAPAACLVTGRPRQ